LGLVRGGILKFEVFPDMDGFVVSSEIDFPNGTPPSVVEDAVRRVQQALDEVQKKYPGPNGEKIVKHSITSAGQTLSEMPRFGPNVGGVEVVLVKGKHRTITSDEFLVAWEKAVGEIPGIRSLSFQGMNVGPPGAPIEIRVSGRDMGTILAAADELEVRIKKFDGTRQVQTDFRAGKNELRLRLKPEARTLGLTLDELARQIHTAYYGSEALRLQRGRDDIRVKIRHTGLERSNPEEIKAFRIHTRDGREIPLLAVADISFGPGYSTIRREDGFRTVTVSAELDTHKANASEIFRELAHGFIGKLRAKYPGTIIEFRGEKKKMRESFSTLLVGFPLAILGIYVIIATIFRSYIQPIVILVTVPFGIIGAIIGHMMMGLNLTMMSMFGIVALSGVVVNDAIVLIECINENLAEGKMTFLEAVQRGGIRRFRAVILTTISTIAGLLPLIFEKDAQARFLIPMALSIAAGVAFATLLTLVLIPSLLAILNDARRAVWRIKTGSWPTREEVEPASRRRINASVEL
jgi:multidrug efflux pump subunit AcrB